MKIIYILLFITGTSGILMKVWYKPKPAITYSRIDACAKEMIELCSDTICEGDTDGRTMIRSTIQGLKWCLEDGTK